MKVKFDENLDARLVTPLRDDGHEVDTVRDQGLLGVADQELYDHCVKEQLVLVSLDKDFSSILRYPAGSVRKERDSSETRILCRVSGFRLFDAPQCQHITLIR